MIRVIYSTGPHLGSLMLRTALMSEWSHCGVIMPDGNTVIEASAKHGVVRTPIHKFTRYDQWAIQDNPVPDCMASYLAAEKLLGADYDWDAIWGQALNRDWHDPTKWICSELVQHCKHAGGLHDLRYEPQRITPRDLWVMNYPISSSMA